MPPPQYVRSKKPLTSNLVITVKYGGLKATQFFSKYTMESYNQLLNDLTELGFPHPKRTNIVFKSHGTLDFFWPIEPNDKSLFVKNLVRRVTIPWESPIRDEQLAVRKELSIISMTVKEDKEYDPYLEHQPSPPQQPRVTKKLSGHSQQPNQHPQHPKPFPKQSGDRFHPYPRPTGNPPDNQLSTVLAAEQSNTIPNKPVKPTISNTLAAEAFLDEMKTSLQPSTNPKIEPVEPSIPPLAPASEPLSMSLAQRNPPRERRKTPLAEVRVKQEQISLPHPFLMPQRDRVRTRSYVDLTREELSSSSNLQPSFLPTFPTLSITGSRQPTINPEISGVAFSPRTPLTTKFDHDRNQPLFQAPQTTPSFPIPAPPPTPTDMFTIRHPTTSIPAPKPRDVPAILRLTDELFTIKNEITTAIDRQNAVIDQLRRLNAAYIPPALALSSGSDVQSDGTAKRCIDELERELESQNAKHSELVKELQAEHNKRLELEFTLQDIERERKAPFVVPALLEAFVKVSQATTAAIQYKTRSSANE